MIQAVKRALLSLANLHFFAGHVVSGLRKDKKQKHRSGEKKQRPQGRFVRSGRICVFHADILHQIGNESTEKSEAGRLLENRE